MDIFGILDPDPHKHPHKTYADPKHLFNDVLVCECDDSSLTTKKVVYHW